MMVLVFDVVYLVVLCGDCVFVVFDYCGYLFVLVWMDDEYDFVMMY